MGAFFFGGGGGDTFRLVPSTPCQKDWPIGDCTMSIDSEQARIQDSEGGGGGLYIQKGGFRTGISGADPNCCRALGKSTSKKKLQTAVGGFPITQKTPLYPRLVNEVWAIRSPECPTHCDAPSKGDANGRTSTSRSAMY